MPAVLRKRRRHKNRLIEVGLSKQKNPARGISPGRDSHKTLCARQPVHSRFGSGHCRSLHLIKSASAVDHLTLCLVYVTTINHFDWTTSFLSDVLIIRRFLGTRQEEKCTSPQAVVVALEINPQLVVQLKTSSAGRIRRWLRPSPGPRWKTLWCQAPRNRAAGAHSWAFS